MRNTFKKKIYLIIPTAAQPLVILFLRLTVKQDHLIWHKATTVLIRMKKKLLKKEHQGSTNENSSSDLLHIMCKLCVL